MELYKHRRMIFFPFDATSLDVDAPAKIQNFVVNRLPYLLFELARRHNVQEWRVVSHNVTVQGNKGLLSIFVESPTTLEDDYPQE